MTTRPNVLFVHQNFPGQFAHLPLTLVARGSRVAAIGGPTARSLPGVELQRWSTSRSTTRGIFDHAIRAEADLVRAQAAAETACNLKQAGFEPDVIIGHAGWGETIHLREVFPRAKVIIFGEYFYHSTGADFGFDPEFSSPTLLDRYRLNARNAGLALAYSLADRIVCPTPFQASLLPEAFRSKAEVFHEGLDLARARRKPNARLVLPNGRTLTAADTVITYVSRRLERIRGFHIFMRALPEVLAALPEAQVVILGADTNAGYTGALPEGQTWTSKMLDEVGDRMDLTRVHFLGTVPHTTMIDALSLSAAHVYYTYPFVLSWSLIEAMACECLIVGSDTAPVRDAVTHGETGLLNEFFDVGALSDTLISALSHPAQFLSLRETARNVALRVFDKDAVGLPAWLELISEVAGGYLLSS